MIRRSLQTRVLVGVGTVLLVVTLASAAFNEIAGRQDRRQAELTRLNLVVAMQARTVSQALWDFNTAQIEAVLDSLAADLALAEPPAPPGPPVALLLL